jgi:hypothetical protein
MLGILVLFELLRSSVWFWLWDILNSFKVNIVSTGRVNSGNSRVMKGRIYSLGNKCNFGERMFAKDDYYYEDGTKLT